MLGCVAYHTAEEPPYRVIGGARFRAVYVARGETLRAWLSARAAARMLAREGIRRAVFPPDYPHREVFARYGVAPPPLAPFYRATAAAIARRYMTQCCVEPRSAVAAFAAESVTPELRHTVESLCAEVRYIVLAAPRGGEAFAQKLRRDHGVAAQVVSSDALPHADLILAFGGAPDVDDVLRLDWSSGVVYDIELTNELLATLWCAGALDADALRVKDVTPPTAGT